MKLLKYKDLTINEKINSKSELIYNMSLGITKQGIVLIKLINL